jgi:ankyrin repeat protein
MVSYAQVLEMEDMQERVEDLVDYILEIELAEEAEVLHLAAEYGGPYLTAKLIDAGFSVSGLDEYQRIPLLKAARSGQVETVKLLLERGSDVNARDVDGLSALHAAVFSGSVETVKILIGNGSEIDAGSSDSGITPLLLAAHVGYLPIVQELVNSGADFNIRDKDGDNALMTSTISGNVDVACWLIQNVSHTDIKPNKAGHTPLTQAIHSVNYDIINCLLQNGFPVNLEDESISPLNAAAFKGNYAVAKILLESGANVNFKEEDGSTPLHLAAYRGHLQVVRLLVAHNADLSAVDVEGRTPEGVAKHNQHFHVARFLRNARKPQD